LTAAVSVHCDEHRNDDRRWYDNLFVEGSVHQYFAPGLLEDYIKPEIGFRCALGYEYNNFRFGVESGFSKIAGTNPLVSEITFVPLVFKFGYILPIYSVFGLQADIGMGFIFSNITRYETAVDVILNNLSYINERSFISGARIYATASWDFFRIYAGGGLDIVFEREGAIPMPLVEAGISVKPVPLARRITNRGNRTRAEGIVFSSLPENIVIEETEQGRTVCLLNAVYFGANNAVLIERYRHILDEAGIRLRTNPELKIILRGYTAPFGTAEGRAEISAARARYCAEYLKRQYGIDESRIKIEYFGAERSPVFIGATWESYRCVELIIE
jgi:outer membrane protein OmpA-like peptidoglycan-associated protein